MFGLGATELVVILVLALILLGPKKLPDVATGLGKAIRQFRKATHDLTSQLDIDDEVKQPFRELKAALRDEPAPYVPPPSMVRPIAAPPENTAAQAAVLTASVELGAALPVTAASPGPATAAAADPEVAVPVTTAADRGLKGS